jgi:exonuclease SbcD
VSAADLMAKDPDQHAQDFEARLRLVIDALCGGMGADTVNLVVAHLSVHGARVAGSERSAHLFQYAVPAGAFPGHLSYVALGHFHRPQQVLAPAPVWYSGSPLQLDFGEAGEDKMVMLVEAEPGLPAAITSVPLTSGRRLVRLSGTLEQVAAVAGEVGDAFVRVELDEPARVGLADEVRRLLPEVVDVILARPAAEGETPPVRIGRNPRELFAEYLRGRGGDDPALLDLFDELVEEAHEA